MRHFGQINLSNVESQKLWFSGCYCITHSRAQIKIKDGKMQFHTKCKNGRPLILNRRRTLGAKIRVKWSACHESYGLFFDKLADVQILKVIQSHCVSTRVNYNVH